MLTLQDMYVWATEPSVPHGQCRTASESPESGSFLISPSICHVSTNKRDDLCRQELPRDRDTF